MGFKAKARKHRKDNPNTDLDNRKKSNKGDLACAINSCDKFADKSLGGRSLSMDNALDMWGQGNFTLLKGRVRVCKSCYRSWKKENKNDDTY
ncbi:MAG: hypothetical protein VX043_00055 [Candidatus Thermoplasmatota archaeon]|nr:hypothetical protein [Candidatus Thermoplasmatota archaeon]MEC8248895.1 hypothetical protein [Candidatus Thermoplasmatota archaeon]MEC8258641.1 hypothetical protein [Candidatus Thermoplasmatota archaeon]MEC8312940.1 hypothetical protein [Candidatus Thermoplasmatota archaeon]